MYIGKDRKNVGVGLLALGATFYLLGLLMFCDRLFLFLGNLGFLVGTGYLVGPFTLFTFFIRPSKLKGSALFFIGLFLLLVGWSILSAILQTYGLFILFRDFIPQLFAATKYIPKVGPYICSSLFLNNLVASLSGQKVKTASV